MVCLDTTALIDEFRARGAPEAPVNRALLARGAEVLIVPVAAAGEFLDGAAMVSERRFQEALALLRQRRVVVADLETAGHYAEIASHLRRAKRLAGRSPNDLWVAATARSHGARVLTRNAADFKGIPGVEVSGY
jgi:predicted nucleic acid-binding protein